VSPWLITTTAWSWLIGATIHGMAGALRRPSETSTALAAAGLACLLIFQIRSRHHRSAS
jgi:hypothetical protein